LNRPSTRSAAEEAALAGFPVDRPAADAVRAPERWVAPDLDRADDPDLARVPELAFEREAGADLRGLVGDLLREAEPALELLLAAAPELRAVDLRDVAREPVDLREDPLVPDPEPPEPPLL
jgi:hypothetical protein